MQNPLYCILVLAARSCKRVLAHAWYWYCLMCLSSFCFYLPHNKEFYYSYVHLCPFSYDSLHIWEKGVRALSCDGFIRLPREDGIMRTLLYLHHIFTAYMLLSFFKLSSVFFRSCKLPCMYSKCVVITFVFHSLVADWRNEQNSAMLSTTFTTIRIHEVENKSRCCRVKATDNLL